MNFFCVGFFVTAFQLNMSWSANYIIKPIGLMFIFGGLWEMSHYNKDYKKLLTSVKWIILMSILPAIVFPLLNIFKANATFLNIFGLIIGSFIAIIILWFQKKILDVIVKDKDSVNDYSAVIRLKGTWKKLVYFTLASIAFNAFNIIPVRLIADVAGLGMAICRVIMYIFAILMLWHFTKVSTDFYKKNR